MSIMILYRASQQGLCFLKWAILDAVTVLSLHFLIHLKLRICNLSKCLQFQLIATSRMEIAKFLPYYKFGPNLENYYLATWRMSWIWHEANLDPCSIVV